MYRLLPITEARPPHNTENVITGLWEMHAYEIHAYRRCTSVKYTSMRCPSIRCTFMRCTLMRNIPCEMYAYELRAYEMHDSDMHEFVAVRCLFRFSPPDQALRLSRRFATLKVPFPPRPRPSLRCTLSFILSPLCKCHALVLHRAQLTLFRDPISRNLITDLVSFS